jgi:hypothetical protein
MAYPQTLWDAIRAYWENNPNASYNDAAKSIGEDAPSKAAIAKRAVDECWSKKTNKDVQKRADIEGVFRKIDKENETQVDGEVDGESGNKNHARSLDIIKDRAKKKVDLKQSKVDGLADVITKNIRLSRAEIDDLCEDYRAEVLSRHRKDFDAANEVVNKCVLLFKKVVDILSDGGVVSDGDVIEKNGFVHEGMMQALKMIDISLKAMVNVAVIKNYAQTNERKSYGLETFEESTNSSELSKKALSQTAMANHYERIRLSKPNEKQKMKDRLKGLVES